MSPKSKEKCPPKERRQRFDIETHGEGDEKKAAEIGVQLYEPMNVKCCRELPEAKREAMSDFFRRASGRNHPCPHIDFRLLASRNCERMHFFCFMPPSLWYLVTEPWEIDTDPRR